MKPGASKVNFKDMPRVLVVSHMYPSTRRPVAGQFIHAHVRALQEAGVHVKVVSPVPWTPPGLKWLRQKWADYSAIGRKDVYDGVQIVRPTYLTPPRPLHFTGAWGMIAKLRWEWTNLLQDFKCDLIHAHTVTPDGFAACKIAKKFGLPIICSARGSEIHEAPQKSRIIRAMSRWTLAHCDGVIAVSSALSDCITGLADETAAPKVIYNGVDPRFVPATNRAALRRQLGLSSTARLILFVGRCEWDKGTGELLRAFESIAVQDIKAELIFVGDGGAQSELQRRAAEGKLVGRVHFPGMIGRDKIATWLQVADVFVLPSYGEGMPNALLEAMAVGLPCIATRVGGIPEVIQDGLTGMLIPPRSPEAILHAVQKIFSSPNFAAELGAAAHALIASCFSWPNNAQQHLDFYQQTIESWMKNKQLRH